MTKSPRLLFVDLDGTLNTSSNVRAEYLPAQENINTRNAWLNWHLAHTAEGLVVPRVKYVNAMAADGWTVILLSMRDARARNTTIEQLRAGKVNYDQLILTSPGDHRTPERMKTDVVSQIVGGIASSTDLMPKVMCLDDDEDVCLAMCQLGVHVIQVIKATHIDQC